LLLRKVCFSVSTKISGLGRKPGILILIFSKILGKVVFGATRRDFAYDLTVSFLHKRG
jgi:hypothetical protein